MEDVTVGGGEGAPENNDDSRRVGRIAVGIGIVVIVALVLWLLWPRFGVIPDVVGLSEAAARAAIEKAGYRDRHGRHAHDRHHRGRPGPRAGPAARACASSLGQEIDYTIAEPSGVAGGEESGGPPVAESPRPRDRSRRARRDGAGSWPRRQNGCRSSASSWSTTTRRRGCRPARSSISPRARA